MLSGKKRLLLSLGTFRTGKHCLQLAAAVLELTCSPQVVKHPQSFVRRCALVACSQVRAFAAVVGYILATSWQQL